MHIYALPPLGQIGFKLYILRNSCTLQFIHIYYLLGDRCGPHQQDPLPVYLLCFCSCFLKNCSRIKTFSFLAFLEIPLYFLCFLNLRSILFIATYSQAKIVAIASVFYQVIVVDRIYKQDPVPVHLPYLLLLSGKQWKAKIPLSTFSSGACL